MISVVSPAYLPNIFYCSWILTQNKVYFVTDSHYQKQTIRNRSEIYGANGKLNLTIPVKHIKRHTLQKEMEVCIANEISWQKQHWKSICSAYQSSPYFEFYERDLAPFYNKKKTYLMHFNLEILLKIMELIDSPLSYELVKWNINEHIKMETLIDSKKKVDWKNEPYTQVFGDKYGFQSNLSILDVLFNLGPESSNYLKNQNSIIP